MPSVRIFIAEDHAMLADALQMLIDTQADMDCIGLANDGASALAQVLALAPDVLLLDLGLPQLDGLAVMQALRTAHCPTRTLVVTARMDAASVRAALALGAAGYVPKNESSHELLQAIRRIAQGRRYVSNDIAALFIQDPAVPGPEAKLTQSETVILKLVGEGLTSKEMGAKLGISEATARKHRENIRSKLGLRNSAEMAAYAIRAENANTAPGAL
ncbi:response regulator transcription factor [Rhodoferax sp. TS-BS-61-7]|uniref:response regulator n=1 Tax=Rhodoferax sp. TS-BS-61-7 TaxID=2094194 RepID=UPI000CF6D4F2|nr:response regulator transcription factor [Rhodoferax sp. TS-BS-61-7]PQA76565.1 DNA-binding response regulator [Rhodoferax sp. TS-BS-61-7]